MKPYTDVLDLENGTPFAQWYNGGTCNVVESALSRWLADEETRIQPALQYEGENGTSKSFTYEELDNWVSRVANGLKHAGIEKGDRVTIYMPMIRNSCCDASCNENRSNYFTNILRLCV